jgi:two-component system chemotaxis sensor kinase CheA
MVMQLDDDSIWSEFANDAGEALAAIEGALLVLEDAPGRKDEINRLYRGLHTIKGNAGFLQLVAIEKLAHVAEDLIGLVRDHGVPLDGTVVDLMLRAVDRLRDGVGKVGRERRDLEPRQVEALVGEIAAAHAARTTAPASAAPAPAAPPTVAAPAGPVIAAPVAPAPPAEPPIELIEPSLDPGYVEVFLSLCNELCPAIGEAVVGAAEPDGAAACAALVERCADLGLAAERMGYVHVQDALAQLARAAERGPVAAAELPELEVALYAALVPIEAAYRATAATPIDVAVASLYQRACAAVVLADVAELHALLEQARPPLAAVHQRFARLRAACAYLDLPHASEGLLSHEDALGRIWERGDEPVAERAAAQAFLAEFGRAADAAAAAEGPSPDPEVAEVWPPFVDLPVSPAIRAQLSAPICATLDRVRAAGDVIVELAAALERAPATAARFHAWLARPGTTLVTSATTGDGDALGYAFLVAAPRPVAALRAELGELDDAGALTLDALDGRGPQPLAPAATAPGAIAPAPAASTAAAPTAVAPTAAAPRERADDEGDAADAGEGAGRDVGRTEYLRIDARKVSMIMELAGELGLASGAVTHHPELAGLELEGFVAASHQLELLIRELQSEVSAMRLVPVAGVFQRMRRVVRDTSRRTGKPVTLTLIGEDTEIDKVMVDALADPLVHLVRNAIDHGLEAPAARAAAGKAAAGHLVLEASHQGGEVSVTITDDGGGLDRDRIWARAVERGLVDGRSRPADEDIDEMIFLPGFSTKAAIDELSGRGVGMDVVRSTIEGLRGRVSVRSTPGRGTRITLAMPLTLAFVEAMIVGERDRLYAVPIEKVFEVFQIRPEQVAQNSADGQRLLRVRDQVVPVCWLHRFYDEPAVDEDLAGRIAVVVQSGHGSLAIPIERLLGNQQIMLKPLTGALAGVRAAAGCGMLRSGDVALTIDCERLHA